MAARRISVPLTLAGLATAVAPAFALAQQSIGELPSDLREAVVGAEYGVVREGQDLRAPNPAQAMSSAFSAERVRVSGADERRGSWALSLALEAWGREGTMQTPEPAEPTAKGRRVEYRRGPLTEWYVNDERGLEQGFTVDTSPGGEGPLSLVLSIGGQLSSEILPSGQSAVFRDAAGSVVLHYTGLRAWDADGRELEASLVLEGDRLTIQVEDGVATYPVHIDPWIASEEAKLTASDPGAEDYLGYSVSLSRDTALVGAPRDNHAGGSDAGSAYVFVRSGTTWTEQAKLTASDTGWFGNSVSLMGDTAVVGARYDSHAGGTQAGSAYVFVRSGTTWTEQAMLTASDAVAFDTFGTSLSLSRDTVVVGAPGDDLGDGSADAGSAYVFVRSGTTWTEQAKLTASDPASTDWFGSSVSLSDDTAVVGAPNDDHAGGLDAGSVYVFVRNGTSWTEQARLAASDASVYAYFGFSVGLSGGTAVVGVPSNDHAGGSQAGSAYVFARSGSGWTEQAKLTASDAAADDNFGWSVSLLADKAVIGAPFDKHGGNSQAGSAYLFVRSGTSWTEQTKLTASDAAALDYLGYAVSLSDDTALVGAVGDEQVLAIGGAGSAYVFRFFPPPVAYCTAGTSASGCRATLSAFGTPSASSASGFDLMASDVEGNKDGLFFFGTNGHQANPWGNGTSYQCVVPPVVRTPTMSGVGTIGQCDGSFALDLNALWCPTCPKAAKNPGPGATVQAQLWYRDPVSTSNQPTSLSDAIEFVVQP